VPPASTTIDHDYATYFDASNLFTQNVGSKPAGNGRWGQADLAGNLYEWVLDYYATYASPCSDCAVLSPVSSSDRVIRGGSFDDSPGIPGHLDTSTRMHVDPYVWSTTLTFMVGVRCARNVP
jgi:formylglycine-generating enzyme